MSWNAAAGGGFGRVCASERGGRVRGASDLRFAQTIVERTRWSPFFVKPQGSLGPLSAPLLRSQRPRSSPDWSGTRGEDLSKRYAKEPNRDAPGRNTRVPGDCRPEILNFLLGWRAGGSWSAPIHLLYVWKRRENGTNVWISWHRGATGGAWESPIVLLLYSLCFHSSQLAQLLQFARDAAGSSRRARPVVALIQVNDRRSSQTRAAKMRPELVRRCALAF